MGQERGVGTEQQLCQGMAPRCGELPGDYRWYLLGDLCLGRGNFGTGAGTGGTAAVVGCPVAITQAKQTSGQAGKGAGGP